MVDRRKVFGDQGELLAADYLIEKGYAVLARQYKTPMGEIDLVCQYADEIVFVEVKSRRSDYVGYPEESVTEQKIEHLLKSAFHYLDSHRIDGPWRLDVISIEYQFESPRITHLEAIDIPERFW